MSHLLKVGCKRCGREIYSMSRSRYGLPDEIREKYSCICAHCMSRKEQAEMLEAMGKKLAINFEYGMERRKA